MEYKGREHDGSGQIKRKMSEGKARRNNGIIRKKKPEEGVTGAKGRTEERKEKRVEGAGWGR